MSRCGCSPPLAPGTNMSVCENDYERHAEGLYDETIRVQDPQRLQRTFVSLSANPRSQAQYDCLPISGFLVNLSVPADPRSLDTSSLTGTFGVRNTRGPNTYGAYVWILAIYNKGKAINFWKRLPSQLLLCNYQSKSQLLQQRPRPVIRKNLVL